MTRFVFTSLALCLFGLALSDTASAAGLCQNVAAPSAAVALSSANPFVYSNSVNANYATVGCKRWVVDASVPSTAPPPSYTDIVDLGGWPNTIPQTQAACNAFTLEVWFYKKGVGGFMPIAGGTSKGVWHPAGGGLAARCEIKPDSTNPSGYLIDKVAPSAGTDIYRIEVGAKISNTWVPVYAKVNYVKIPA